MLYIGMDLHKNTTTLAVKTRGGKVVDVKKIPTEPAAIQKYLAKFNTQISLAVEPVSQWYFYADLIQKMGVDR